MAETEAQFAALPDAFRLRFPPTGRADRGRPTRMAGHPRDAGVSAQTLTLPPGFIVDYLESDCDVGTYARGQLTASDAQLEELRSRGVHYVDANGPDQCPPGLKQAAKALLAALHARL